MWRIVWGKETSLVQARFLYLEDAIKSSRSINVRLDSESLRKARILRESGVSLSDVVREEIDQRFLQLRSESKPDVRKLISELFERYPDRAGLPSRGYDVHDRSEARQAILRKLHRMP